MADEILNQLVRLQERSRRASIDQLKEAARLKRMHYFLGIPAIIISTIVGSTAFISASEGQITSRYIILLIAGVSMVAAILSSLMTFLGYNERAEKHRITGGLYSNIRRRLEAEIAISKSSQNVDTNKLSDNLRELSDQYSKITENAPIIDFEKD
ncbi:SLATT domain-containing protein [Breoghania sp. L-A4]|uniref:SLATT domain-containing protein n=1 Tax=Breoghania sp. L-A4 TaxID=2304600 RepID=UPI000E3581D8|nr:SLATT domain-containing protein [Breoghania sp. L-A4]AXS39746.1 DUF4231 domain-containing protein [Breoghania sp. L-A4]